MQKWVMICIGALMLCVPAGAGAQTTDAKAQTTDTKAQTTGQQKQGKWSWTPLGRRVFISLNGLTQGGDTTVERTETFDLYDERGEYRSRQGIKTGAGMVDVGGGVRLKPHGFFKTYGIEYGVGLSYTTFNNRGTADISGSLPHPLVYDKPRTYSTNLTDLNHKEEVVHLAGYLFYPFVEKVDFSFFFGPSFYSVSQGFATGITFSDVPPSFDSVSIDEIRSGVASDSAVGFNIGGEVLYDFMPNVTAAVLLRYTRATVDLDVAGTPQSLKLGNAQIGAGVRLRF